MYVKKWYIFMGVPHVDVGEKEARRFAVWFHLHITAERKENFRPKHLQ
jgi:hypothetical protein